MNTLFETIINKTILNKLMKSEKYLNIRLGFSLRAGSLFLFLF